jgi:subtilisin family serine protease
MALRALNTFGHTRASYLAEAITYAANQGARVINLSLSGEYLTRTEQKAIDYAYSKGAVVVVAAGNEASNIVNIAPAGLQNTLTVAATDFNDKRSVYSNWGAGVDIAAPGDDVLSLRARRTDLMRDVSGVDYTAGQAYVGVDKRYYRTSGTSFSAPMVAGTAALLFSLFPHLTNEEVERMIVQSARDIDVPGKDQHSGYGLLDARAALSADPNFFAIAEITGIKVITEGASAKVQVLGTADADRFKSASLEIGAGKRPAEWKKVSEPILKPVRAGILGYIPAAELQGSAEWTIRLIVQHQNGKSREAWFNLKLK